MSVKSSRWPETSARTMNSTASRKRRSVPAHPSVSSKTFGTNVIVICHGQYMDLPDKTVKIFPQGVGQKLSPKIPQYFPVYVRVVNKADKRSIQIKSNAMIDLAVPAAIAEKDLTTDTGLAEIFAALRPTAPAAPASAAPKPKSLTLRRV